MASGCILGTCKHCNEFIWEDEEIIANGIDLQHKKCIYNPSYVNILENENKQLKHEIQKLKAKGENK